MIRINLVSRIDDDKNSFLELVYVAHKLKESGIYDFQILFIGAISKPIIYHNILQMAKLLGVQSHIEFTQKSIPMAQLSAEIKDGYFLNYSVGDFIGYSGIDSINLGFKTIFCNVDKNFSADTTKHINYCPDLNSLIELIKLINTKKQDVDNQILENNLAVKKKYSLNGQDKKELLSFLLPKTHNVNSLK